MGGVNKHAVVAVHGVVQQAWGGRTAGQASHQSTLAERGHACSVASVPLHATPSQAMGPVPCPSAAPGTA